MKTEVIHIKNSKGTPDEVYIGRAGKGKDGYYGNPVSRGKKCPECGNTHYNPTDTLPCFRKYLNRRLENDQEFKRRVAALAGKTLVCFCKPNSCHGDYLAEAADRLGNKAILRKQKDKDE